MAINKIGTIGSLSPTASIFDNVQEKGDAGSIKMPFSDYFKQALGSTSHLLIEADRLADDFAAGRTDNIHQVVLATEKADIALQFTMQIRNKIMDAYNEIMRMQI